MFVKKAEYVSMIKKINNICNRPIRKVKANTIMKHLLKISDDDFRNYKLPEKQMLLVCLTENLEYDKHFEVEY